TPLLIDGRVVALSMRGNVVSVDPKNGAIGWNQSPAGSLKVPPFVPSPAYAAKRVFVADNIGSIFALDAATGATVWRRPLGARPNIALVVVGKNIVVGTDDHQLSWIDGRKA